MQKIAKQKQIFMSAQHPRKFPYGAGSTHVAGAHVEHTDYKRSLSGRD